MTMIPAAPLPTFALPGRWWRVPLDSEEAMTASTRAMAKALYPGDELVQLRQDIRGRVAQAADEAAKAGAMAFHFAVEVVPGAPVPLTPAIYAPELPTRLSAQGGARAAAESLAVSLRTTETDAAVSAWGDDSLGVVRVLAMHAPDTSSDVDRPVLQADYWLTASGSGATTVFSFSAPLIWEQTAPALLELLDAIISTVQWSPGGTTDVTLT